MARPPHARMLGINLLITHHGGDRNRVVEEISRNYQNNSNSAISAVLGEPLNILGLFFQNVDGERTNIMEVLNIFARSANSPIGITTTLSDRIADFVRENHNPIFGSLAYQTQSLTNKVTELCQELESVRTRAQQDAVAQQQNEISPPGGNLGEGEHSFIPTHQQEVPLQQHLTPEENNTPPGGNPTIADGGKQGVTIAGRGNFR
jgi:hypothetical protein